MYCRIVKQAMDFCLLVNMLICTRNPSINDLLELWKRIVHIGIGISKGFRYLHSKRIVLRDLNPENIGFDVYMGTAKELSFGYSGKHPLRGPRKPSLLACIPLVLSYGNCVCFNNHLKEEYQSCDIIQELLR